MSVTEEVHASRKWVPDAAVHAAVEWEVRLRELGDKAGEITNDVGNDAVNDAADHAANDAANDAAGVARGAGGALAQDLLRAFAAWHDAAPEHAAAWATLQARLARMGGAGAPHAAAVAQALRHPVHERRRALRAGFGMALVAVTGLGSWGLAHELGYDATWRSATGERGAGTLADGSPLRFDAGSRIDLAGAADGPLLRVRQGQLLVRSRTACTVEVAGAAIDCGAGAELCAGQLGRSGIVAVRGGAAVLRQPGRIPVPVADGETHVFGAGRAGVSPLTFNAASAWTRGVLVADRMPLADVADALARYHRDVLHVGATAAGRVISGVLRLDDLDGALRQVAAALPVRVRRHGFVTLID